MVDGSVNVVQIQEVKNRKLIYTLCCEDCAVPREFKLKNVDTLIYNSNREQKNSNRDQTLDSLSIYLRHAKRQKTISLGLGDKIKISGPRVQAKGEIVSISKNIISIKPRKKKLDVIDSIDVSQLYWIKKYNSDKGLRALGGFVKAIGVIGVSFFTFTTVVVIGAAEEFLYITVPSTLLSSTIYLGGYYMKGGRKYIGDEKWQVVEQTN